MSDPKIIVRSFLDAMELRDLETAARHLAPGFTMTFPGGVKMKTLSELVAWARSRYVRVSKSYHAFETFNATSAQVVYCSGTLAGDWLDGSKFEGIRFIDRFELENGLLTKQDVWNDMGEVRLNG